MFYRKHFPLIQQIWSDLVSSATYSLCISRGEENATDRSKEGRQKKNSVH